MSYEVLLSNDSSYPDAVRAVLNSPKLYAIGNVDLLKRPSVGICGSRDASEEALRWSYHFGTEAANQGIIVVSGYARGVDREAHKGVLQAGGSTIAVLPDGIRHFKMVRELRSTADLASNFLALSMFDPDALWSVWRAMERNKLIVALSAGLFVIEARERGGTINAAYESIRQGRRLWAVAYERTTPGREGNKKLLAGRAVPLKHLSDLEAALEEAMAHPPAEVRQLIMVVTQREK